VALTLIVTALQIEARPWIQALGLKQDHRSKRIPVYRSADGHLAISGSGPVAAAITTTLLLQPLNTDVLREAHLFNIGLCGSSQPTHELGTIMLGNCIKEFTTQRTFIPDVLARHSFAESAITTVAQPMTQANPLAANQPATLYDMEAAGIYQAATVFLAPHQIHFLKIVSDHLENQRLDRSTVQQLLAASVAPIHAYMAAALNLQTTPPFVLNAAQQNIVDTLTHQLQLTQTQATQLQTAATAWSFHTTRDLRHACAVALQQHPQSKQQRNRVFKDLLEELGEVGS